MGNNRADVTVITASTVMAMLAILAPVASVGQPIQFMAVLGGILLGPGALAYRLVTGAKWAECLMIGVTLNIAALMVLALTAVAIHFWHPKVELIIPAITCVLAVILYRRHASDRYEDEGRSQRNGYPRASR